jgi:hypothetical protein
MKVPIGCIVVFFGFMAVIAVAVGVGGFWLKGMADDAIDGVEARADAQREATDVLERLHIEYPFSEPTDGRIDPGSAARFFEATDLAWTEIEPTVRRLDEVADRGRDGRPRLGDIVEGVRSTGLLADSRLHIARALDDVDMPLNEYVWTGGALRNAWRNANAPESYRGSREAREPAMTANIELARRYSGQLDAMYADADGPNRSTVLDLATAWSRGLRPITGGSQ